MVLKTFDSCIAPCCVLYCRLNSLVSFIGFQQKILRIWISKNSQRVPLPTKDAPLCRKSRRYREISSCALRSDQTLLPFYRGLPCFNTENNQLMTSASPNEIDGHFHQWESSTVYWDSAPPPTPDELFCFWAQDTEYRSLQYDVPMRILAHSWFKNNIRCVVATPTGHFDVTPWFVIKAEDLGSLRMHFTCHRDKDGRLKGNFSVSKTSRSFWLRFDSCSTWLQNQI